MPLSWRQPPYKIPEYSLTGDLLAYLTCGLQYRYYNKGSLPPSTPVQLWFGEFIHGIMEEAYLEWRDNQRRQFPWSWDSEVRNIEIQIDKGLKGRGLYPPPNLFCPYDSSEKTQGLCSDTNHPHQLIASKRAEKAINTWGQHLFPLIDDAEVRLGSIRDMPNYQGGISRSNYYGVTGVIDVISSVNLQSVPSGNLILHYIHQSPLLKKKINDLNSPEYEIIIDYKGMRRPPINNSLWQYHEWQILTYAWLRSKQPESKPIVAGILFYLNELVSSSEDMKELKEDVAHKSTDIMPQGLDLHNIVNWRKFRESRSIRIISADDDKIQKALGKFDGVVSNVESCVFSESGGSNITSSWQPNPNERTCTACDFKTFCPNPAPRRYYPTVP